MMAVDSPCEWIDLVIARAIDLRKAGVLSIGFDGCSASFAPADPVPPADDKSTPDALPEFVGNVMDDPASYPGGYVPGFEITPFTDVED